MASNKLREALGEDRAKKYEEKYEQKYGTPKTSKSKIELGSGSAKLREALGEDRSKAYMDKFNERYTLVEAESSASPLALERQRVFDEKEKTTDVSGLRNRANQLERFLSDDEAFGNYAGYQDTEKKRADMEAELAYLDEEIARLTAPTTERKDKKKELENEASRLNLLLTDDETYNNFYGTYDRSANEGKLKSDLDSINKEIDSIDTRLEMDNYDKYLDDSYGNTFTGRFSANATQGRLSQDINAAWNSYLANPTKENREKALYIEEVADRFAEANKGTLEAESKDEWITKSLAGYLPQAWDNFKGVIPTTIGGAVISGVVTGGAGAKAGGKLGYVAGSAITSFKNMRGAEFSKYINAGVDETIAEAAANESALAMAAIEGGESALDVLGFGAGKLLGSSAKLTKALSGLTQVLGSYAGNVASEGLEEMLQEIVSITALERASRGETGVADLIADTVKKLSNLTEEEKKQVLEAGAEGAKIALMLGLPGRVGGYAMDTAYDVRAGRTVSEMEIVDEVIAEGLDSNPDTKSHKIAEKLQAKREGGKEISNKEIGKLFNENKRSIEEGKMAEVEDVAEEPEEKPSMASLMAQKDLENAQAESKAEGYNVIMTPADKRAVEMAQYENDYNFEQATSKLGDSGAKALRSFYNSKEDFNKFYDGFSRYYEAGLVNLPNDKIDTVYSRNIPESVRQAAYMAGQNDAKAYLAKDKSKQAVYTSSKGFVENEFSADVEKKTKDALNFFGKVAGVTIQFVDEIVAGTDRNGNKIYANGNYENGVITIAKNADNPYMVVAKHEITHHLQKTSPEQYRVYRDYAVRVTLGVNNKSVSDYVRKYSKVYDDNLTEKAMDEIAADFTESILTDTEKLQEFINGNIGTKEGRTMLQTLADAIRNFLEKIGLLDKKSQNELARNEFGATVEQLEEAEALFIEALKSTEQKLNEAKAKGVEESSVATDNTHEAQLSLKYDENNNPVVLIEENIFEGKTGKPHNIIAEYIAEHIGEVYTIIESGQKVYIGKDLAGEYTQSEYTKYVLRNNRTILKAKNQAAQGLGEMIEIATNREWEKNRKAKHAVDAKYGWYNYTSRFAVNTGKQNADIYTVRLKIRNDANGKKYLYDILDIKKAGVLPLASTRKGQLYRGKNASAATPTVKNVTQKANDVKLSLKDSSGNTLTEEQAEFFKDSKVRDENGNLKVVYHGTEKAGFTVFEETKDIGYFFTDSTDIAWTYSGSYDDVKLYKFKSWEEAIKEAKAQGFTLALNENGNYEFDDGWGVVEFEPNELKAFADELAYLINDNDKGIYKAYLNIKNPLIVNGNGSNWDSVINYEEGMVTWDELSPDVKEAYYDEYGWNIDEMDKGFYGDMPIYLPDANYPYFASVMSTREWVQEAVDGGYDGVIFKNINDEGKHGRGYGNESNVYVVLESNQIKSVYNENPTSDPDIRYSVKLNEELESVGLEYDSKTESINPRFSLKTWNDTDKERTIKALQKVLGKSREEIEKYINDVNGVAKYVANNKILDYESNSLDTATAMKPNSEYKYTIDFSTLCKKRLLQTGTIDAIQHRLPDVVLTGEDYVRIRQMMKQKEYEVACGLCYVESRRKALGTVAANFIKTYKKGKNNLRIDDLTTTDGIMTLMQRDRDAFDAFIEFNNKRGQSKVNLVETRVEYDSNILKLTQGTVDSLNAAGGLRVQSFSDFEVVHLIDMMQVALDMAEKGLKSQAYTKVPAFAEVMGLTGMKINLSLIAKGVGYDAKGNLLFDDVEGMPFKTAMKLRNKFSENVGTILVGINDRHIELAMADDRIDYIIPYHRSGWAQAEYEALGISGYENYTSTQNEKWKDPYVRDENGEIVYNSKGEAKTRALHNIQPSEYWDYNKTGEENAKRYLELCEEQGRIPKFPQFAYDANGNVKKGYWKLLIDFKMYDNDGVGAPQRTVTPEFDSKVIKKILKDYVKGEPMSANKLPVASDIVEEFVAEYNAKEQTSYSLKGTSDILKENAKLKEYNTYLKEQMKVTKGFKFDKKAISKMAKTIAKEYSSKVEVKELEAKLTSLYDSMQSEKDLYEAYGDVKEKAVDIAKDILNSAVVVNNDMLEEYSDMKNYFKTTAISIADVDKADLPDGYAEFRRRNMGRIKLTNNGVRVDKIYGELSELYPAFFDAEAETHPAEQLMAIEDALNKIQPFEENPFESQMDVATEYLANDIINNFFDVPQAKATYADKQQAKLDKKVAEQKQKDADKLAKVREEKDEKRKRDILATRMHEGAKYTKILNEKIEAIRQEGIEKVKNAIAKEIEYREKTVDKIKKAQKAKEARMSDRRKRAVMRSKIIRHINPMKQKLLSPNNKSHVPQEMRRTVATLLDAINLESNYTFDVATQKYKKNDLGLPSRRTAEFEKLREQYEAIMKEDAGAQMVIDSSLFGDKAEGIESNFEKVIAMRDKRLADMNLEELTTVWETLKAVETSILTAGRMLSEQNRKFTEDFAEDFRNDTAGRKDKRSITGKHFSLDLENPYTFFSHFGQAGKDFYRILRNAQDKEEIIRTDLVKRMEKIVSSEKKKALTKDIKTFELANGEKITLSKAHIMNLYLLYNRPQAKDHLLVGGIVQPEVNRKVRRGTDAIKITEQDLKDMFATLDDEDKKIADGLQKLTLFLAEKGNEVTMIAYGYEKFTDPNYWTIKSAKEGLLQTVEEGQDLARSIRNMGSAKQVVPHASNPLEIGDVFSVFDAHASDMITYSAWLLPMEDSTRLFNFRFRGEDGKLSGKTMKGLLNKVGGVGSDKYWMNLMRDIQNGISSPADDTISTVINKTIGNVKKASVAGNIRVVAQQPTAYLRAMAVLSPDNMSLGALKGVTKGSGWKKALKYAPIASIKQAGGFEVSANPKQLSETLYSPETKKGKAVEFAKEFSTLGAVKADEITWGIIWNACEWQVARENESLPKGSEAFYQTVAELFTEVIDQTQVVDGVLQRSQTMRSSHALNKQATAFMGEPTLTLNLLMRSYDAWRYETNPTKRSAARKKLGRAVIAVMASNVAVAMAQSMVDALRDDDEEKEYLERYWKSLIGIKGDEKGFKDIAKNILMDGNLAESMNAFGWVPYIKDITSMLQGYTVERMDAGAMADFITSVQNVMKSFNGEGKWTKGYSIAKMMATGSKIFGSSASNMMRDIESIFRSIYIEREDWESLYDMNKAMYDVNKEKSRFIDILYQSLKSADEEAYSYIEEDLYEMGVSPSSIESRIKTNWKNDDKVGTDFVKNAKEFAGIILDEESGSDSFGVDDLTQTQEVEYDKLKDSIVAEIQTSFDSSGFESLDKVTQNRLLDAAIEYSKGIALRDASDGEYKIGEKWINAAESGKLGVDVGEFLLLYDEYGTTVYSDKAYEAVEADIDIETFLEVKDATKDIDGKDASGKSVTGLKKERIIDELEDMKLSDEEFEWFMTEVFGYKSW